MPIQTADFERGLSAQNAIVTAKRNKLGEASLDTLMIIKSSVRVILLINTTLKRPSHFGVRKKTEEL